MQTELDQDYGVLGIALIGVNYAGYEAGIASMTDGRDIPLLQDTELDDVLALWSPTYRDVLIVDADSQFIGVFNLTEHDLANVDNYAQLRSMLLSAAVSDTP